MAMHVFSLTPTQQANGQQIYSGFFNYATAQGADSATATQFANIGLGVASGEGLGKGGSGWGANPDRGVTSVGPFQLNIQTGLGAELNGNRSPANQIQVAASNMWGESGTGGSYNTQPWNAVGDTTGPGNGVGNDTYAGQSAAEKIGSQIASNNGFTAGGAPAPAPITSPDGTPLAGGTGPTNTDGTPQKDSLTQIPFKPDAGASGSGGSAGAGGSATIPQAIDKQSAQMGQDTQAGTKAANSISSAIIGATKTIAATASATEKNLFTRGVMILVGALFLVGGLYMFGRATIPQMKGLHT